MNYIICPVHNGLDMTKRAVATFLAQDIGDVCVLLILNNPTDGTEAWANAKYDILKIIMMSNSVAQSWNAGLNWVLGEQRAEHCLVVNNDVELLPETYRLLVEDGDGFVTAVGVGDRAQFLPSDSKEKRPNPDFSCFLIKRRVWERVGKFDEKFEVAYCEDWDYHCRLHKAGIDAHCISIPFLHHAAGTLKSSSPKEEKAIQAQAEKNREYFFRKWGFKGGTPEYYAFFGRKE